MIRRILPYNSQYEPNDEFQPDKYKYLRIIFYVTVALTVLYLLFLPGCAQAYTDQDAIKTIIGEASNQGFKGMVCVGEVIRHRHSLKGFYGLHASHSANEPVYIWKMAKQAWERSKYTNFTQNAMFFENIETFGRPYWLKNCVLTYVYKNHKFYRESRRKGA